MQTTFTAEGWSGTLTVQSALDATVENDGVERYRGLSSRHLTVLNTDPVGEETVVCVVETNQSHIRVAEAARTRAFRRGTRIAVTREVLHAADRIGHQLQIDVAPGQSVTVEKLVTIYTSRDNAISDPAVEARQRVAWLADFDELLDDHVLAWRQLWRPFHMSLSGEHARALKVVRLHLFHLFRRCRTTASTSTSAYQPAGCTVRRTAGTCCGTNCSSYPFSTSVCPC